VGEPLTSSVWLVVFAVLLGFVRGREVARRAIGFAGERKALHALLLHQGANQLSHPGGGRTAESYRARILPAELSDLINVTAIPGTVISIKVILPLACLLQTFRSLGKL
jgi:hypothetical protein